MVCPIRLTWKQITTTTTTTTTILGEVYTPTTAIATYADLHHLLDKDNHGDHNLQVCLRSLNFDFVSF
jgi:hypothetical protein